MVEGSYYWAWAVLLLFAALVYLFFSQIGRKIVVLNIISLLAVVQWLLAPLIAYTYFDKQSYLAVLWQTVMPISADAYFSFALPATLCLVAGLNFPAFGQIKRDHYFYLEQAKRRLASTASYVPALFIGLGFIFYELQDVVPLSLRAIFNFASLLSFVAVLYAVYAKSRLRFVYIALVLVLLLRQVIQSGMFGEFVFWTLLYTFFFLLGKKPKLATLLFLGGVALLGVLSIQAIKSDYRKLVWKNGERGSDAGALYALALEKITDPSTLLQPEAFFFVNNRMNQGAIVAKTIEMVPEKVPFANGATIGRSILAALVPRVFWPNKPMAGGHENVARFLKDKTAAKRQISYNLGPIGEAYANFGRVGGCLWLFFYGCIFRFLFLGVLHLCRSYPTLVLWIPFLFIGAIKVETDLLSTLGSVIKGGIFVGFIFFSFHYILKIRI